MPWKEQRAMSLKIDFVERFQKGEKIAPLCVEFGISRTTGHKWVKRFEELGYAGLDEKSRRPKTAPFATAEDIVMAVLDARDAHPRWGPQKLQIVLQRRFGEQTPSERTVARILARAHRVQARRRRRPANVVERAPQERADMPNEIWTADYKGWWRASNGQRCEPLTVRDAFSRFVLTITICPTRTLESRAVFDRLFQKYGLPGAMQCDNGIPFVSVRSRGGISALSAWWLSLGIKLVRSRPACPQDNGGHERMHRDVSADVQSIPAANRDSHQRLLDRWQQEFNHVRPHQALGGKTPGEVYTPSQRRIRDCQPFTYPATFLVTKVTHRGMFFIRKDEYFLSGSLVGHDVGIEQLDDFHIKAWFRDLDLGVIEVEPQVDDQIFDRAPRPTI